MEILKKICVGSLFTWRENRIMFNSFADARLLKWRNGSPMWCLNRRRASSGGQSEKALFLQTRVFNKMTTLLDQVNIQGNKNGWILFIDDNLNPSHEVVWGVVLVWRGEETRWEGVGPVMEKRNEYFYVSPSLFNHGEGMVEKNLKNAAFRQPSLEEWNI